MNEREASWQSDIYTDPLGCQWRVKFVLAPRNEGYLALFIEFVGDQPFTGNANWSRDINFSFTVRRCKARTKTEAHGNGHLPSAVEHADGDSKGMVQMQINPTEVEKGDMGESAEREGPPVINLIESSQSSDDGDAAARAIAMLGLQRTARDLV